MPFKVRRIHVLVCVLFPQKCYGLFLFISGIFLRVGRIAAIGANTAEYRAIENSLHGNANSAAIYVSVQ